MVSKAVNQFLEVLNHFLKVWIFFLYFIYKQLKNKIIRKTCITVFTSASANRKLHCILKKIVDSCSIYRTNISLEKWYLLHVLKSSLSSWINNIKKYYMMASTKDMATNIVKLDRFDGEHFLRWQKRVHFLQTLLHLVYVINTPSSDESKNETINQLRRRQKWEIDDYTCKRHILNAMNDSLFDLYYSVKFAKELWEKMKMRYMKEDATSKKFLVSHFNIYFF